MSGHYDSREEASGVSIYEIAAAQCETREPFKSVGVVCVCGRAIAGIEGAPMQCAGCGQFYIVSVMVLRAALGGDE